MLRKVLKVICRLPERTIEQLARNNYNIARAYYLYKLRSADRRYTKAPLLVYQMGKVGSSSVTKSLKMIEIDRPIYHAHFLTPELINKYEKKRREFLGTHREAKLRFIWQSKHLYKKRVEDGFNGKKWKIVTLVRDPVARNLSTFFQHIEVMPPVSDQQWRLKSIEYDFEITVHNNDIEELIEHFFKKVRHYTPIIWFDRELKKFFDIDLFASDFPLSRGYKIYKAKEADILLIRLESLNDCANEAFKEFLDIDNLTVINTNVSNQKEYVDVYRLFKDYISLPESYLDKLYSSKVARHFYSEAEIKQFRARWSRKPDV